MSLEIVSKSISIDLDACKDFLSSTPSTFSIKEPSDPNFDLVNELGFIADFERVTTITTSVRGD